MPRREAPAGSIAPARLVALFDAIAPNLVRYPAIDPRSFRERLQAAVAEMNR